MFVWMIFKFDCLKYIHEYMNIHVHYNDIIYNKISFELVQMF